MNHYTIVPMKGEIRWDDVPWLYVENQQWGTYPGIRMGAQICYSDRGLHVHMRAWEKKIRAALRDRLAPVCDDSCMELFISPVAEDPRYFNIEMNPNGCVYLGFATNRLNLLRLVHEYNDPLMGKDIRFSEDGWELWYTIPLDFIRQFFPGYTLEPGRKLRANVFKCGDRTAMPHFFSWNLIELDDPNFHVREYFGEMELG